MLIRRLINHVIAPFGALVVSISSAKGITALDATVLGDMWDTNRVYTAQQTDELIEEVKEEIDLTPLVPKTYSTSSSAALNKAEISAICFKPQAFGMEDSSLLNGFYTYTKDTDPTYRENLTAVVFDSFGNAIGTSSPVTYPTESDVPVYFSFSKSVVLSSSNRLYTVRFYIEGAEQFIGIRLWVDSVSDELYLYDRIGGVHTNWKPKLTVNYYARMGQDYDVLSNKPRINGHTLTNDLTAANLGLATILQVENAEQNAQTALNIANSASEKATEAHARATDAHEIAEHAYSTSTNALERADEAQAMATNAHEISQIALNVAEHAYSTSNNAQAKADNADAKAIDALVMANDASEIATEAHARATEAHEIAEHAYSTSTNAQVMAYNAQAKADNADAKARDAHEIAEHAYAKATDAHEIAEHAYSTSTNALERADEAQAMATNAHEISQTALNVADYAFQQISDKAPLDSPVFTGTPTAPDIGTNTTSQIATKNYVDSGIKPIADRDYVIIDASQSVVTVTNSMPITAHSSVSHSTDQGGYGVFAGFVFNLKEYSTLALEKNGITNVSVSSVSFQQIDVYVRNYTAALKMVISDYSTGEQKAVSELTGTTDTSLRKRSFVFPACPNLDADRMYKFVLYNEDDTIASSAIRLYSTTDIRIPSYNWYLQNGTVSQNANRGFLGGSNFTYEGYLGIGLMTRRQCIDLCSEIQGEIQNLTDSLSGKVDSMENVSWEDLKLKRDNGELVPGSEYRITNYWATSNGDMSSRAVTNQFDIIVVADATNVLNETARAIRNDGDTYFPAETKFEAWRLQYCLNNDTNLFAWAVADADGGRGVIYRLVDEFDNDVPYDFKGLMFRPYGDVIDIESVGALPSTGEIGKIYYITSRGETYRWNPDWYVATTDTAWRYTFDSGASVSNTDYSLIGTNKDVYGNRIGMSKDGDKQILNRIVFKGALCNSNTFGINCRDNVFGQECIANDFGDACSANTFGRTCLYNKISSNFRSNTFGDYCYSNSFDNFCYSNTFGAVCYSNIFGTRCSENTFDYGCSVNTFGNECSSNSFGRECRSNTFGYGCSSNTFGNGIFSNTFGNFSSSNTFGDYCRYNTFGNDCINIKFGTSSTVKSYCRYITIQSGNQRIYLNPTGATSSSAYYQNVEIKSGVNNTPTWKTITDSNVNQTFHTTYQPKNSQVIEVE